MNKYGTLRRPSRSKFKNFQTINTQKNFVRGILFLIVFTLFIIFIFGDHGLFQLYKLRKEREMVQKHISELRKEREKLITEKNRLNNNLEYIEKLARERYRMAKPGEQVFKVIPNDKKDD